MRQLRQNYDTGRMEISNVPASASSIRDAQVKTTATLISAGTEKMVVDLAKKSALGKARARPDLTRQVFDKITQEGLWSTIEKVRTKLETPIPLGYSAAGIVTEAGSQSGVVSGDRVACGGAGVANHAEYNIVPRNLMVSIPDAVSDEDASFVTVGAIALQGVRQAAPTIGERIGVIGLGLIGQLTVQILRANGCDVLGTDIDPWKIELALQTGADAAVNPDAFVAEAKKFTDGYGFDAVIITASTKSDQPIRDAGLSSRRKGRVVSVGLTNLDVPRDLYYYKELDLRLSHAYGPGRHDPLYEQKGIDYPFEYVRWTEQRNFKAFLRLVETGAVTPQKLITHRFAFENAIDAYELITKNNEKYLGIILQYPQSASNAGAPARTISIAGNPVPTAHINLSVVGTGGFAKSVLLPRLRKRKDISRVTASSRTGMSARHAAVKFGFAQASTDYTETIESDSANAVVIATRHNSHGSLVAQAFEAKKHAFVEKPLAIDRDSLDRIVDAYNGATIVQVGFNRRFSSHAQEAQQAVAGRQAYLTYRVNAGEIPEDSWIHDPEIGGGRIIGEVCHFIDTASYIFGSSPLSVVTVGVPHRRTHDDLTLTISYDNGSVATIVYVAKGSPRLGKELIEVFADGVAVSIDNFRKTVVYSGNKRIVHKTRSQDKGFDQELDAFFASIKSGTPAIPFGSLVATTKVTFAAVESLRTGVSVTL